MNTSSTPLPQNLADWLQFISQVHPREIELGLERARQVAQAMELRRPAPKVITVAGTNGKGSTVAVLESLAGSSGLSCGAYTSPHIIQFNERIRINGSAVDDGVICDSFARIERARGSISLSYFEFATLAALDIFAAAEVDIAVLEVGLGGRLDAVNIVDPDVSVITSIALDHEDWLGSDRGGIALEKAGILRPNTPFVCGDDDPPAILLQRAAELACPCLQWQQDFHLLNQPTGEFQWRGKTGDGTERIISGQITEGLLASNIAGALQAWELLQHDWPSEGDIGTLSIRNTAGRQQWVKDKLSGTKVLLDVAHNPAAMAALADCLQKWRDKQEKPCRIAVVFAVMADKKVEDMAVCLESNTDIWYIAEIDEPRCLAVSDLEKRLQAHGFSRQLLSFGALTAAYRKACSDAASDLDHEQLVVVAGSFLCVAAVQPETSPIRNAVYPERH